MGHCVHQPAGEVAIPYVERRGENLQLPQRLDREGTYPAARRRRPEASATRESGEIEVGGAIDLEAIPDEMLTEGYDESGAWVYIADIASVASFIQGELGISPIASR